jgi:hypothetical protein
MMVEKFFSSTFSSMNFPMSTGVFPRNYHFFHFPFIAHTQQNLMMFAFPTEHVPTTQRKIPKACRTLFIAAYGAGLIYK